jgi:1-acyl-sn-glycerol-3-phosphate acyltransferase
MSAPTQDGPLKDRLYPVVIRAALLMFRALRMTVRVEGAEKIPASGGVVLASNHVSYLDFIFAGFAPWRAGKRLTRFMAKDGVFRDKVGGPLMRGMHHIPVDRESGTASFRTALKMLKAGEVVGVFPEATISRSFTVKELKSGAVRMAAAAKAPVVPVALWGTQRLWTKGHPRKFLRGQTVTILVGDPIVVSTRDDMDARTEELRASLQALLDRAQAGHPSLSDAGPHAWWLPAHLGGSAPTPDEAAALDAAESRARREERDAAAVPDPPTDA